MTIALLNFFLVSANIMYYKAYYLRLHTLESQFWDMSVVKMWWLEDVNDAKKVLPSSTVTFNFIGMPCGNTEPNCLTLMMPMKFVVI